MPTKEQLEETNDQLRAENASLQRAGDQMVTEFADLREMIENRLQALATQPPAMPAVNEVAQQATQQTIGELAPLVARMGQVIATMERAHTRAEERIEEADERQQKLTASAEEQSRHIQHFTALIAQARAETAALHEVARQTRESFFDVVAERWRGMVLLTTLAMLVGALAGAYGIRQMMEPDMLTREESDNWRILMYNASEQQRTEMMAEIKAKRQRIEQESDSSQPLSEAEQAAAQNVNQNSSATPAPASGTQGRTRSGRRARRQ